MPMEPVTTEDSFTVTCVTEAEDDVNWHLFSINVVYAGRGRWAIRRHGRCLNAAGQWDYESIPSERTDEWLAAYRFDRETALRLAAEAAPKVTVNGWTVTGVLADARKRRNDETLGGTQ